MTVNHVSDFDMPAVETPKAIEPDKTKTQVQWRDELLAFGLIEKGDKMFIIEGQLSPIYIALASNEYRESLGYNPRLGVTRAGTEDKILLEAFRHHNVEIDYNFGSFVKTADFSDRRTVQELGNFLLNIEKSYRLLKSGQSL